jgi:Cft2 family RNA processing exonuclease
MLLSGWATGHRVMYHYDKAIPFSDHADFQDLVSFIEQVAPKKIYTTHGFVEFPRMLRQMGLDAELLRSHNQISLF